MKPKEESEEVTEGWMKDFNKVILLRKKDKASSSIGLAMSSPVIENIKIAYGLLSDFSNSLVHTGNENNKTFLELERQKLRDIGMILYSSPTETSLGNLYKKYKVRKVIYKQGIYNEEQFVNLPNLVFVLEKIFQDLNEFAQKTGFGSPSPFSKQIGLKRLIEEAGLTEDEL